MGKQHDGVSYIHGVRTTQLGTSPTHVHTDLHMSPVCLGAGSSGSGSGGGDGGRPFQFPEAPEIPQDANEINLDLVLSLLESLEKGVSESSQAQNEAGNEVRGSLPFLVVVVVAAQRRESAALSILRYCCCIFSMKITPARALRRAT